MGPFGLGSSDILSSLQDPSPCMAAVAAMSTMDQALYAQAAGFALPRDAGKYNMCTSLHNSRYFLLNMNGGMMISPGQKSELEIPMSLGLCLPNVCDNNDAVQMLMLLKSKVPAAKALNITDITSSSPDLDLLAMDSMGFVSTLVFSALVLLVIGATTAHIVAQRYSASASPDSSLPTTRSTINLVERTPGEGDASAGSFGSAGVIRPDGSMTRTGVGGEPLLDGASTSRDRGHGDASAGLPAPRRRSVSARAAAQLRGVLTAFSLFGEKGTIPKLMECPPYKPTDCLNGLRVLSMLWIMLGHTFLMPEGIMGYANPQDILRSSLSSADAEDNLWFYIIVSSQNGVDTFFFLSGFLLSLLTLKELRQRQGNLNVRAAILMRYLRLTPSLALAMLVYYQIWPYLASGPFAASFQKSIFERCRGSWWSELTYTLNFIPYDSDKVCMGWTWYLGDDMIFFVIVMALVLPMYYRRSFLGWVIVLLITFVSSAVTSYFVVWKGLSIYAFDYHYTDYSYWAYSKPFSRIPAYLVGVVAAWFLDDLERRGITRSSRPAGRAAQFAAVGAAACAWGMLVFLVFIVRTDFGDMKNSWGTVPNLLYINLSRPLWSMSWATITILCYYDYLPWTNSFLSHPAWTPLARLTYGVYLMHPLVIKLAAGTAVQFYTFSGMDMFYRLLGNAFCAFSGSLVLWCLIERPVMTLTSIAKGRSSDSGPQSSGDKPGSAGVATQSGAASSV